MTRLILAAAALAAGLTTFAAQSQEAPTVASGNAATAASPASPPDKADADKKTAPDEGVELRVGRDNGSIPGVDMTLTSSVKPDLVLKSRSGGKKTLAKAGTKASRKKVLAKGRAKEKAIEVAAEGRARASGEKVVAKAKAEASGGGYDTIIARYASAYDVPVSLAHAVIKVESNYRSNARGRAGEIGLMQIKPATARMMGYSGSAKGLFDPDTNIRFGMKYLAKAHQLGGGTTCGTILKYNAGHAARRMNKVSAAYCSKVKRQLAGS